MSNVSENSTDSENESTNEKEADNESENEEQRIQPENTESEVSWKDLVSDGL